MYVCLPPSGDSTGALHLYMWFASQLPVSFYWQALRFDPLCMDPEHAMSNLP